MYNRMKLHARRPVFDKEFKAFLYPITLEFIVDEFDEEELFLSTMNLISMDGDDLLYQADKIMFDSRRSKEPITDLVLTRYKILMIYIIQGIKGKNIELFLPLIKSMLKILGITFGCEFKFILENFEFVSKEKIVIEKKVTVDDSLDETVKTQLIDFLIINEDNFEKVCDSIKEINGWSLGSTENKPNYNPANEKARMIAEQLNKSRKKIQEMKAKQITDKATLTDFISSYCTQTKINVNEVYSTYTLYQFFTQSARESLYFEYNTNIQAMLHGASDVKLKNWSKKIN